MQNQVSKKMCIRIGLSFLLAALLISGAISLLTISMAYMA